MSTLGNIQRILADAEAADRSGYCEMGEHSFCHPQDVYVSGCSTPVFSITCTCFCHHKGATL